MVLYGLIGYPLKYSGSPALFREKFKKAGLSDRDYRLFPIPDPGLVRQLVETHPGISGLNVTIPFKESIIPYLDDLDPVAREIGAVNTIGISGKHGNIRLTGYNTDAEGFIRSASFSAYSAALILGTGGAAKAVACALSNAGIRTLQVSRNPEKNGSIGYSDLDKKRVHEHNLIINATPCGMFPEIDGCPPLPFQFLKPDHFLYDLIYNPEETVFLRRGKDKGCKTQNGLKMLQLQADLAYMVWTGGGFARC